MQIIYIVRRLLCNHMGKYIISYNEANPIFKHQNIVINNINSLNGLKELIK